MGCVFARSIHRALKPTHSIAVMPGGYLIVLVDFQVASWNLACHAISWAIRHRYGFERYFPCHFPCQSPVSLGQFLVSFRNLPDISWFSGWLQLIILRCLTIMKHLLSRPHTSGTVNPEDVDAQEFARS